VKLEYIPLAGTFLRLQPFAPDLKEEVRSAVDCDPDAWAIMPINPMGDGFDAYWSAACGAPPSQRMAYAIRRCSDNRVIGMSTYYTELLSQGGVSIGTSFLHPSVRSGPANPEAKLLMLDHAFHCGAVRVQFKVDTRNQRSQGPWPSLALSGKVSCAGTVLPGPVTFATLSCFPSLTTNGRS